MTGRRSIIFVILLVALAASVVAYRGWLDYNEFLATPLQIASDGLVIEVVPGDSGQAVVSRLAAFGATVRDWRWRIYMRMEPVTIKTGEYLLMPGLKPAEVMALLASGQVIQHRFTIVEGWTYRQLMAALMVEFGPGDIGSDETASNAWTDELETWTDAMLADKDIEHAEGWFLPETYLYTSNEFSRDILSRSHQAMIDAVNEAWSLKTEDSPLNSPHELLILASIIEKETARDDERTQVAGVFVRRLQKGMRLQTDPTVIYGMGELFDGDIRRRDLRADTPYNTYTRHGLPPTPISLPGRASLVAAAQPAAGETLYFVANGLGGHTFSATLKEHQEAVKKLLRNP